MTASPPYLSPINPDSLTAGHIEARAAGRPIYIWGAAFVGNGVWKALTRNGLPAAAFLDSSPRFQGQKMRGLAVLPPESVLNQPAARQRAFVITASGHWEDQLKEGCLRAGFLEGEDFLSFNDLTPIQPAIEISGRCNLKCQGCPRGNMGEHPPAGFMGADVYARVLDKLLREIPLLGSVQLYTWGEPLLNRDFFKILAETRDRGVLSIISTNLSLKIDVGRLVEAGPGLIRLSASGFGSNYEKTHTGGRWALFEENFWALAEERRRRGGDFAVELYYHLYRHNQGEDLARLKRMADEAGFVFRPIWGCLYPWDNLLRQIEGRPLSEKALEHKKLLVPDLDALLDEARRAAEARPCTQVRCFPINWDLKVLGCGGWYLPRLADNFLETPLRELIEMKLQSQLCRQCAAHGIHRVNFPFMADQAGAGTCGNAD